MIDFNITLFYYDEQTEWKIYFPSIMVFFLIDSMKISKPWLSTSTEKKNKIIFHNRKLFNVSIQFTYSNEYYK